ncbi:histidine phosphatase family containing protein [Ceratobasidium sp. AG-Ba]|nr:histidine phosphatase family containing protein [Ceratobasidium sp. AG-Ba]QRW11816.1 histidine phosphatase family containing protein [Ceratobasidium sp. AG-Ba]
MTSKRVYLLRHGQAEHNVNSDFSIHDAPLTALGRQQCVDFTQADPSFQNIPEVILTSAFRRTLSTTLLALPEAYARLVGEGKVILLPQLQETHDLPCDTGSDRVVLEATEEFKDMASQGIDWSPLTEDWNKNQGFYAPTIEALENRAKWVRNYVRSRPEKNIVLVGHGGIFREIDGRIRTGDDLVVNSLARWGNVECRLYTFLSDDDEGAIMVPIAEPTPADQLGKPTDAHVEDQFMWSRAVPNLRPQV